MAIKFPGIQLQLQTYKSQSTDKTFGYMIKKYSSFFNIAVLTSRDIIKHNRKVYIEEHAWKRSWRNVGVEEC